MAVYSTILTNSLNDFFSSSFPWLPDATVDVVDGAGNLYGVIPTTGAVYELAKTSTGYATAPTILTTLDSRGIPTGLTMDAAGNLFGLAWDNSATHSHIFELAKTSTGYAASPTTLLSGIDAVWLTIDGAGNLFAELPSAVLEIAKTSNGYSAVPATLATFQGDTVFGGLTIDSAGNLFGVTDGGVVFEIAKTSSGYANSPITLANFHAGAFGYEGNIIPTRTTGLAIDAAGNLFGTAASSDGQSGTVFEIVKTSNGYAANPTTLAIISEPPFFGLSIDSAGNLYGTAPAHGQMGSGVFELARTSNGYASSVTWVATTSNGYNLQWPMSLIRDTDGNIFGATSDWAQYSVFELSSFGVTISGTAQVGQTITASASGGATSYQWEILVEGNWLNISGATGSTYVLTQANEGRQIRAQAVGAGGVVTNSSPTQAVVSSNGNQYVFEATNQVTIGSGQFQYVYGTAFNTIVNSGGEQDIYSGGTSNNTTLTAGSFQTVWGTSLATRVDRATQFVWGVDFNADVVSGGAQYVGAGGVANNARIIDGTQLVWGVANSSTVWGDQKIYTGGAANRATVYGTQYDWGTATDTDIAGSVQGGVQYVYGMASRTTIRLGGIQHVASGGSASNTSIHVRSSQYVYGGGAASGTSLYEGYQFVSGTADQTTIHSGRQDVYGSVTNTTTDASGTGQQNIYAGGTATNTTLGVGYYQTNWGAAYNTILNGGIQNVYGTATNTTVNSATSVQYVEAGASANNTTIGSDGTENVLAGGSAAGVTFAGAHAHLILAHASSLTGSISGWQGTDTIDLGDIAFGSKTTLGYAANANHTGGVLTVSDGSHVATLSLLGQYAAASFALSSDGYGGVLITNPAAAGQVQSVLASPLQA